MKHLIISLVLVLFISIPTIAQNGNKLVSKKTHIKFFSHTSVEDIEANNYKSISTLNTITREIIFSIPMQSFEFKKSLMQKHYNSPKYLDTKQFPKAKLKGQIININDLKFNINGKYKIEIKGEMTIHGVTKNINETATLTVEGSSFILNSVFNITLADYGVAFEKGKSSKSIAKVLEITVVAEY